MSSSQFSYPISDEELEIALALEFAMFRKDEAQEYSRPHQSPSTSTSTGDDNRFGVGTERENMVRLLLLGKTGSGKSTTGNTILGQKLFSTAVDFGSVTSECERHVSVRGDTTIEIMDSPGLFDTHKTHEEICTNIVQAVAGMHPGPHAVLYVIRVGRFTAEEYAAYRRLKALFDDSIVHHIILVFTHGDELEREGKRLADLMASPNTPENLKQVFRECGHRCQLFNNMASDPQPQVDELLTAVRRLVAENGGRPYSCPKYSNIGEGMEEEVTRRLEKFEKRDLQRQRYVKELEQQTKEAERAAERMREEISSKEQQWEEEARKEKERRKKVEENLKQQQLQQQRHAEQQQKELDRLKAKRAEQERQWKEQERQASQREQVRLQKLAQEAGERERELMKALRQHHLLLQQQRQEEQAEQQRQEREWQRLQEQREKQRRRDMEKMDRRNREQNERMARQQREARKLEEQLEQDRLREMEQLKAAVVKKEEPAFFGRVLRSVTAPIRRVLNWFS